jgi:hypothetical protein
VTRPLSAKAARAIIDAAELVKAPDHRDTNTWHVVADGRLLAVITPSYGGVSRTGRNGWRWTLHETAARGGPEKTTKQAAVAALGAWERWATYKESR